MLVYKKTLRLQDGGFRTWEENVLKTRFYFNYFTGYNSLILKVYSQELFQAFQLEGLIWFRYQMIIHESGNLKSVCCPLYQVIAHYNPAGNQADEFCQKLAHSDNPAYYTYYKRRSYLTTIWKILDIGRCPTSTK